MGKFRVTAPDGRTFDVNGPDGSTQDDAIAYVQSTLKAREPAMKQVPVSKGSGGVADGVWKGLSDPFVGGSQLVMRGLNKLGAVSDEALKTHEDFYNQRETQYQADRALQGREGFDFARLAGNVVNPTNVVGGAVMKGATGLGSLALRGGVAGAAGAAMQPVDTSAPDANFWAEKAQQAAMGGVGGAVLTPAVAKAGQAIGDAAANVGRRIAPRSIERVSPEVDIMLRQVGPSGEPFDMSQIPKSIQDRIRVQAGEALRRGEKLDPTALARTADFESLGVPALRGQVTRDPAQYTRELNLRGINGVGEPIQRRLSEQTTKLGEALRGVAPAADDTYGAGQTMLSRLRAFDEPRAAEVSRLYQAARDTAGTGLGVNPTPLAQRYSQVLEEFGTENIPSAVRSRMESFGLAGGKQTKMLTVEDAERLIKTINANYDPAKRAQASALADLKRSAQGVIDDLGDSTDIAAETAGAFRAARTAARDRFASHERMPALKEAIEGTPDPVGFVQKHFGASNARGIDQLKAIKGIGDPEIDQTFRGLVTSFLRDKAFGANAAGDGAFGQARFNEALRTIGREKLGVFFTPDEVEKLFQIGRVGSYITQRPTGAAVNESNTGAAAMNLLSQLAGPVARLPGLNLAGKLVSDSFAMRDVSRALSPQLQGQLQGLSPTQRQSLLRGVGAGAVGLIGGASGPDGRSDPALLGGGSW